MTQWWAIEFLAVVLPEGHEAVHVGSEALVVVAFVQVDHLVDDDVF